MGIDRAALQVHDGLVGVFKGKAQPLALAAVFAVARRAGQRLKVL